MRDSCCVTGFTFAANTPHSEFKSICRFLILEPQPVHFICQFPFNQLTKMYRFNRFSMPVNGTRNPVRYSAGPAPSANNLGTIDTSFLLDDHEHDMTKLSSPIALAYAQLGGDDTFPTLTSDGVKVSDIDPLGNTEMINLFSFPQIRQLSIWQTPKLPTTSGLSDRLVLVQVTRVCLTRIQACIAQS